MDCTGCHTPGALAGKPDLGRFLGGSDIGFHIPEVGILYPPNLTPDMETGIGSWSVQDIIAAVRTGVRPDGRELFPLMPWPSYGFLTDDDALALATYLKSLPAVSHQAPATVAGPDQAVAPYLTPVVPVP
ncbi:MAG: cytochrome c, partial [Dongiaceae bacterium]